jgi:transcriptional regulator with GAF, ATPase, and Fis domain
MPVEVIQRRVQSRKPCPQALCAIPVEVDNRIWGVLVLDSRRAGTINYQSQTWHAFTTYVQLGLGELLNGV